MEKDVGKNAWVAAAAGFLAVPTFYLVLMVALNSASFIPLDLRDIWPYLLAMSIGFGLQTGLFVYIREMAGRASMAASAGTSGGAMAACCAHHATDILPIVGLTAIAGVLDRYRIPLLLLGVFSNIIGVMWMLAHVKKHKLYERGGAWKALMQPNWPELIVPAAVALGGVWLALVLRVVK